MNEVILIQPLGELDHTNGLTRTYEPEPLTLEYLQTALEQVGVSSSLYYDKIDEDKLFQELLSVSITAVCFSVYTYQYPYCLELAKKIKTIFKNINKKPPTIIFGGYHPSAMPEEVIKEDPVDIVVKGEGEYVLQNVINKIVQKESLSSVNGIWYKDSNGTPFKTNNGERITDIDQLPLPRRHFEFMSKSKNFQIIYPAPSQQKSVAQMIYSRGCPHSCIFCSSENMWGKKAFWRKPEKVLDEIEYLHNEYGINAACFHDLTFNLNRNKVFDICNEFIKRDLPVYWFGLFRLDKLDKDILFALKEAKCVKLTIGFESDDIVFDKLKSNFSLSKDDYLESLSTASKIGLLIRALFIIGFPNDTEEKIRNYNNFLRTVPIDEIRVTFITPFPGTKIWAEYQQNYLPQNYDFSEFTTDIPVINHPKLTKQQLLDLRLEVVRSFYLDSKYHEHVLNKIARHPHLKNSYFEYFNFLENKGVIDNCQLTNIFKEVSV